MQFKAYVPQTLAFTDSTAPSLIACKRPPSPITGCHHFAGIWSPACTSEARLAVSLVSEPSWLPSIHFSPSAVGLPCGQVPTPLIRNLKEQWQFLCHPHLHNMSCIPPHATTYPPWAFSSPLDCRNALLTGWLTSSPCPWWSVLHPATSVLENHETDPVIPSFKLHHVSRASPSCPGLSEGKRMWWSAGGGDWVNVCRTNDWSPICICRKGELCMTVFFMHLRFTKASGYNLTNVKIFLY